MEIKTHITKADLVEFRLFHLLRDPKTRYSALACAFLPPVAVLATALMLLSHYAPGPVRLATTVLPGLLFLSLYTALFFHIRKRRLGRKIDGFLKGGQHQSQLGEFQVILSEEGVTVASGPQPTFRAWKQIQSVIANGDYGYIYTGPDQAIIIPQHDFPDYQTFRNFVKSAVIYHWNRDNPKPAAPAPEAAASADLPLKPISMHSALALPVPAKAKA
jgi:hypothetical protein